MKGSQDGIFAEEAVKPAGMPPRLRYIAGYRDYVGRERGFLAERVPPSS